MVADKVCKPTHFWSGALSFDVRQYGVEIKQEMLAICQRQPGSFTLEPVLQAHVCTLVVHLGLHLEGVSACEEGAGPQSSVPQQATIPLSLPHTASFFKDSQSHLRKSVVEIINI